MSTVKNQKKTKKSKNNGTLGYFSIYYTPSQEKNILLKFLVDFFRKTSFNVVQKNWCIRFEALMLTILYLGG